MNESTFYSINTIMWMSLKSVLVARHQWLMHVILAVWELRLED
jgi:hypothetical protein